MVDGALILGSLHVCVFLSAGVDLSPGAFATALGLVWSRYWGLGHGIASGSPMRFDEGGNGIFCGLDSPVLSLGVSGLALLLFRLL